MTRTYTSPLRERQAAFTRSRILLVAARLFAEQGYWATSVRQIAVEAHVSLDRIYNLGGKAAVFLQALESALSGSENGFTLMETEAATAALTADSAEAALGGLAVMVTRSHERSSALWAAFVAGASIDQELAGAMQVRNVEMRRQAELAVATLVDRRLIDPLPDRSHAADLCWAAAHPTQWALLVDFAGWSGTEYCDWFKSRTTAILVHQAA